MFYVYILKSEKFKELYVGSTNDLKKRIIKHNNGEVSSTKSKIPYKLVYYEAFGAESDARRRENMLKCRGQARRQLLARIKDTLKK